VRHVEEEPLRVYLRMLALWARVTFFRPSLLAYSKA